MQVNSVLSENNNFYKVFKRFVDKKSKNESVSDEIEWINSHLLHENRKSCENAVNILIRIGANDFGIAFNALISAFSRASNGNNYDLIGDGIFKLMRNVNQKYGIINKPHPLILMISESSEKMLYLSKKIEETCESRSFEDPIDFLRPILFMTLCSDTIYAETREIWRQVLASGDDKLSNEILSLRRVTSPQSCLFFNSLLILKFKNSAASVEDLLLLIASTKYLTEYFLDPTKNFELILASFEIFEANRDLLNVGMFMLAEILQRTSITHVPRLVNLIRAIIIDKNYHHPVILHMILDGLIQIIAYPSFASKEMKNVEKLLNYITELNNDDMEVILTRPSFQHFNADVSNAFNVCKFFDSKNFNFKSISSEYERIVWKRNQLALRGFILSNIFEYNQWKIILNNLIEISREDDELKNSLVMPLLFNMTKTTHPKVKVTILQNLIELGASTEVFSIIKALSQGILRSMAIDLHLRLWKIEPRTYPFLYKVLVEKSSKDHEDFYLDIVRASAIKDICDLKPHHGSDLVTIISDILNQDSKENDVQAALAIDAIVILCQNHIINITSTWKAISLTTRYEKRPRVIKSLCNFFALVPTFKRNNSEYELLMKDIIARVFHMIQWSDLHGIQCALEAFKSWNYDQLTLDLIPDTYREGIALPEAPVGMEVSILDLEVPGDCFVQLLTKVNTLALGSAGDLISHFISQEISEYRSGHYIVKDGQAEPTNYKTLPKQSILKAITQFVIQQATTRKQDKIVSDEILIEALRVLARKYSQPLPPLNWTFLHELVHRGQEIKALCMAIATKQAVISGTAKRLAENILINICESEDEEAALDILADLCNGISSEVLKLFFEKAVKSEIIDIKMQKCLSNEKSITNRKNLGSIISMYIKSTCGHNSKDTIKLIPSSIMPFLTLNSKQKIEFRCEILKETSNIKIAVGWINDLIAEQNLKSDDREFFIEALIDLFTDKKQLFPKKKWLSEFMTMTENKMIEKSDLDCLLDIFSIAIICFSGIFELFNKSEIFEKRFNMFPHAVELISNHATYNDIIGSIFDFIYFVVSHNSPTHKDAFISSIICAKNHHHFKKSKNWLKILEAVVVK